MKVLLSLIAVFCLSFSVNSMADAPERVSVMSFNAENLFDELHDAGTTDWTYLPLAVKQASKEGMAWCRSLANSNYRQQCLNFDWTQEKILKKIAQVARVIRSAQQGGPDIIVFQEVENLRVLTMLRDHGLAELGYKEVILFEGEDTRGIDVGIISRFPLSKPAVYHQLKLNDQRPDPSQTAKASRGILEATFNVNGRLLTVLGNHWPSQNNPDWQRVVAAKTMLGIAAKAQGAVVMAGDFNVIESDSPHAINQEVLSPKSILTCFDAEKVFFGEQSTEFGTMFGRSSDTVPHRGTHYHSGKWTSLDRFFIPRAHVQSHLIAPVWDSYHVVKFPFQIQVKGSGPRPFEPTTGEGVSDHLPIMMSFDLL